MGFEGSLCLKPLAFQKLYSCVEAERLTDNRDETPWTWHACLAPDELGTEACAALLPEIRSKCTGSESLTTETAGQYSCSPECAGSLVSAIPVWLHVLISGQKILKLLFSCWLVEIPLGLV